MIFHLTLTPPTLSRACLTVPLLLSRSIVTDEVVFEINGERKTRSDVLRMNPEDRSPADWLLLVDWTQVRQRPFVIVDPYDPSGLLYLNHAEYLVQTRTFSSNNIPFSVIYRPGVVKPTPLPKIPPLPRYQQGMRGRFRIPFQYRPYKFFIDLKLWLTRNCKWGPNGTVQVNDRNVRGLLVMWFREVSHLLGLSVSLRREERLNPLISHYERLLRSSGVKFTVIRMKITIHCILSYIAGNPLKSTEELGQRIRLTNGLPRYLGKSVRLHIRSQTTTAIRLYTSLLVAYKAFAAGDQPVDLATITTPYMGLEAHTDFFRFIFEGNGFFARFGDAMRLNFPNGLIPYFKYSSAYGKILTKGGANSSISLSGALADAWVWAHQRENLPRRLFEELGDLKLANLMDKFACEYQRLNFPPSVVQAFVDKTNLWHVINLYPFGKVPIKGFGQRLSPGENPDDPILYYDPKSKVGINANAAKDGGNNRPFIPIPMEDISSAPSLVAKERAAGNLFFPYLRRIPAYLRLPTPVPVTGRLHAIQEAAGKVRVVAICDYFTQLACEPIHTYLFNLLRGIPQDGTFNQQKAVDSLAAEGHSVHFSYDLKAATDLIPIDLYKWVLTPLLGKNVAELWSRLMTERDFLKPFELLKKDEDGNFIPDYVRYTRGQPMGALSSWASMALVHHALVQYAASQVFDTWFTAYRVLGDDIIICDARVASRYVELCASYGIRLSMAKSLISNKGVFNFASQTFVKTENVSTISLKETLRASTWDRRVALAHRVIHRTGAVLDYNGLLRRVATFPMWECLRAEITHGVRSGMASFVHFVLQSPFVLTNVWDAPYIDSIIAWLGLLNPKMHELSSEERQRFENALRSQILKDLEKRVDTDLKDLASAVKYAKGDIRTVEASPRSSQAPLDYTKYILEIVVEKFSREEKTLRDRYNDLASKINWSATPIVTHELLKLYSELLLTRSLPVTWRTPYGTQVPWATILEGIGDADATRRLEERLAGDKLAKQGIYENKLPTDSLKAPLEALMTAAIEVAQSLLPVPRNLSKVTKETTNRLFTRFADLRRDHLRRSWLVQAPGTRTMNVEAIRPVPCLTKYGAWDPPGLG